MTVWEQRIINAFIEKYPGSAAAEGGRALRIKAEVIFPHFSSAPPSERESFLDAAEALEHKRTGQGAEEKLVSINWIRKRKGEEIAAIVFEKPEALFALAGKASPALTAADARRAAHRAAQNAAGRKAAQAMDFFSFLAESIDSEDAVRGMDAQAVNDLEQLFACLAGGEYTPGGMTPRAVSVLLYNDSKRMETILKMFSRLLAKAFRENISVPDLSFLDRSFPEAWIAGRLNFAFKETKEDTRRSMAQGGREERPPEPSPMQLDNSSGIVIGLPLSVILKVRQIEVVRTEASDLSPDSGRGSSVLMIENKETFYTLAEQFTGEDRTGYKALLYTGGYPNRAVQALAALLAESGFSLYHAGDLDIDGILILQELMKAAAKPIQPVKMDGATFDRYKHCGRKLDNTMLKHASRISGAILSLPGIAELAGRIQETRLGIEQEIIDYGHI
ncbi:MAG: DUF2220 domain-containing protein [Treponema sp.]|jgi:hypothetical protein|nr:DUF2220 domain-containing protein [Treponema sp.]